MTGKQLAYRLELLGLTESYQFREALYEMHTLCNAMQSQETCMSIGQPYLLMYFALAIPIHYKCYNQKLL